MTYFLYWLGRFGGYGFDLLAFVTRKKLTTQFDASKALSTGFKAPYTLGEGLARTLEFEFIHQRTDDIIFKSE